MATQRLPSLTCPPVQTTTKRKTRHGSIEPEPTAGQPHVIVQTSALVDDFGAMYFEVYNETISLYFGKNAEEIHISFTDQALLNLARLLNEAIRATMEARAVTIPDNLNGD